MKTNNMGKLLGVALVVAIMCTGLFYMMFAMKANSQTGTPMTDLLNTSMLPVVPASLAANSLVPV